MNSSRKWRLVWGFLAQGDVAAHWRFKLCRLCWKSPNNTLSPFTQSVSARLSKNLRDRAFSQLGQTLLAFMNTIMNVDILIKRISDHQLVAGLQDYEWQISPKCGSDGHLCHHYSHHRFGRFVRHCPSLPFTHFPPSRLEPALPRPFLGTLLTSTRYKKSVQVVVMILMDYDDLLSCPSLSLTLF